MQGLRGATGSTGLVGELGFPGIPGERGEKGNKGAIYMYVFINFMQRSTQYSGFMNLGAQAAVDLNAINSIFKELSINHKCTLQDEIIHGI